MTTCVTSFKTFTATSTSLRYNSEALKFYKKKSKAPIGSNRPFYSCVLSDVALNWKRGWGDLVLIQTSLLFICKCKLVSLRTA